MMEVITPKDFFFFPSNLGKAYYSSRTDLRAQLATCYQPKVTMTCIWAVMSEGTTYLKPKDTHCATSHLIHGYQKK